METKIAYGAIIDAVCSCVFFFNNDMSLQVWRRYAKADEDVFTYYKRFRESKAWISPSERFFPFFYFDGKSPCLMSGYLEQCLTVTTDPFSELKKQLRKPYFKRYAYYYYLGKLEPDIKTEGVLEMNPEETAKAIAALSEHKENLKHFAGFFTRFEELLAELIDYLSQLYQGMLQFHKKYAMMLDQAVSGFLACKDRVIKSLEIKDHPELEKQAFSLCLIHQYAFLSKKNPVKNAYLFIIGINVEDFLINHGLFKHLSAFQFGSSIGTKLKYDIIEELRKGEKTISQLSKTLYVSRTTIDRVMQTLHADMAVSIGRKNGAEKYYALNSEYFASAKSVLIQYIDELLADLC